MMEIMSHEHHSMESHEHNTRHGTSLMEHAHGGHADHQAMITDFKKRFVFSLILTVPVLFLSLIIQQFLHLGKILSFPGDLYVLFVLSSIIFFYGGWPFLKGLYSELLNRTPGMMTLIAIAISVAYLYSSLVVFGLSGMMLFF
jgi:Cu2+-exporting ATPase